jgi:8-oxo-dGTP pyrophosphatase MutT (NUDIX family)
MENNNYSRLVQTSVTLFIHCGDDYLFLKRNNKKKVDPNKYNGVGGRLEYGEYYISAAIRETEEETGFKVGTEFIQFCGMVRLLGGYETDWILGVFKIDVPDKNIPIGAKTEDGNLVWINKGEIEKFKPKMVPDIVYYIDDLVEGKLPFFYTHEFSDQDNIIKTRCGKLY